MNYHKLNKKLEKLEKKFPEYNIIAINKREVITTKKGQEVVRNNLTILPRVYNYVKNLVDYNKIRKDLLDMIGE